MNENEVDSAWEEAYSQGEQLNGYPYDSIVSFVFKNKPALSLNENVKVLELGYGAGNNLQFLCKEGFDVFGIDSSPTAHKIANDRLSLNDYKAKLTLSSFKVLPYTNSFFDLIFDRASVTHVPYEIASSVFREVERCLKVNGSFYTELWSNKTNANLFKNYQLTTFYDRKMIMGILPNSLEIKSFTVNTVVSDKPEEEIIEKFCLTIVKK